MMEIGSLRRELYQCDTIETYPNGIFYFCLVDCILNTLFQMECNNRKHASTNLPSVSFVTFMLLVVVRYLKYENWYASLRKYIECKHNLFGRLAKSFFVDLICLPT